MFFKLLHKIKMKPEESRKLFTLITSAFIAGIIAIIWAINFIPHLGDSIGESNMANITAPFNKVSAVLSNNPFGGSGGGSNATTSDGLGGQPDYEPSTINGSTTDNSTTSFSN